MENSEKLTAARSSNRDVPEKKPGPEQTCSDVVNISIFFDGTGNNKDVDEPLMRWSNPARIWRAAQFLLDRDVNHSIYVSGVGTPYNGTATDWMDQKLVEYQDGDVLGMGAGAGGTRRMDLGEARVNDHLRKILTQSAAKLDISIKPYLEKGRPANIKGLAQALEAHGLITIINLSIFGFSRGASLARAFSNEMVTQCTRGPDGMLRYKGVPIRFSFMGLFDTVASFGLPRNNFDAPFDEKNLVVPHAVERCVHFVAAHELRFSFPVDLIRKDGKLMPNWSEMVYPGVHSDVGGGYELFDQKISNNYARIPMRDMMREALKCGVRITDYDDIKKFDIGIFCRRFEIKSETLDAYKKYMGEIGTHETIEQAITAHMKALYSAWGTMTRRKIKTPDLVQRESETAENKGGHPGIAFEAALHLDQENKVKPGDAPVSPDSPCRAVIIKGKMYGMQVRAARWRLDAWKATASDSVLQFIQHNVHDSKAGFLHAKEPFSYFTARGMAESSQNVLARGLGWIEDTAIAIKNGIIKVYYRTEGVVVETWQEGKLMAVHTYRVGEKFVIDTVRAGVNYTVEVYQTTKQVLIAKAERGKQVIITSIDMAKKQAIATAEATQKKAVELADATQKKAGEIADATQRKASEIADATQRKATEFADATQRKVGEIADATHKKASEVGNQIYDGASSAVKGVGQAVDTGMQAVEDGWHAVRSAMGI